MAWIYQHLCDSAILTKSEPKKIRENKLDGEKMIKKTVGQILVEEGALSAQALAGYEQEAHKEKIPLVRYLQEKRFVSQEAIARAYAQQSEVPYLEKISDEMADPLLLSKVPLKFLRENSIIPIKHKTGLVLVVANPMNFQPIDDLTLLFGNQVTLAVAPQKVIFDALNHYYPLEGTDQMMEDLEEESDVAGLSFGEIDERDILSSANDAPIIKLVNYILFQAVKMEASDIHVEPEEKEIRVRYRIDGIMRQFTTMPKRVQGAVISRVKIMAGMNIAEKRKPQDGRIEIRVSDKRFDIRVNLLPVIFGEKIVMRILDKEKGFAALEKLGFSPHDFERILKIIASPNGIILVSGPTGAGKTTTLYSILSRLNEPTVNIVTVEDPVEYQLNGISQVQVTEKAGLTFAVALRAILRQDPDIVMIGETRDGETAQIAIQAALTGHVVLSTIHTNSAPATITRLIDMGIEPFLIASSIVGVIGQRLVRKLCQASKEAYTPSPELLKNLGIKPEEGKKIVFYRPKACDECESGYKGRLSLFEIMVMSDEIARLTMERAATTVLRKQAVKDGMVVLLQDGVRKVEQGLTSIEEVLSVATAYDEGIDQ